MSWGALFTLVHVVAFAAWALLLVGPRGLRTAAIILYLGVGILCLAYAAMFIGQVNVMRPAHFMSIEGIRTLFSRDGGIVLGWTHYLALDLFTGQWIAKDADHKGFSRLAQAPLLFLTLLVGPIGLLIWLVIRERRARRTANG